MNYTPDLIASALFSLSPDCTRAEWLKPLMAVKSELGDNGRELAISWSQQSDKFNQRDFDATWRSISPGGSITIGSLIHLAKAAGWKSDARISYTPSKRQPAPPTKSKTLPYAHVIWEPLRGCPIARSDAFVTASTYAKVKRLESAAGAARGHINSKVLGGVTDCIIVPLADFKTGRFCGVELIAPNGKKATYGNKGVLMLGNDLDQSLPIHVCEGWADAAAILFHNNGNILVYAVFSKSRLDPIAQDIDEKYQGKRSVIIEREDGSK